MNKVEINFVKTSRDAVLPTVNHNDPVTGDAGADLTAVEEVVIPARDSAIVPIGLTLAYITPGYWFKIESRSGLGFKHGIQPHFGIIDNGYRNDLAIKLYNLTDTDYTVKAGDRIAQMIVYKMYPTEFNFVDVVDDSDRGAKGIGSSGA